MNDASSVRDLLRDDRLAELGPGTPVERFRPALQALTLESAFAPAKVVDPDSARACLAGLWLHFDFLEESHRISQDLDTIEGSYWHALMHRREPDFWNAKYWFRRVGRHPIFEALRDAAAAVAKEADVSGAAAYLLGQDAWDPMRFVDLCEAAGHGNADPLLCRRIQRREWELLFEFCHRRALAT